MLPTRVVDVGDSAHNPKIYESLPGEEGIYCALSYCWGRDQTLTTTSSTLEDRKVGFHLDRLPKTIRDAVQLARSLHIKYLWVDSLCIVQDSTGDWEREAARMCAVYSSAAITFAAMDSPGNDTIMGGKQGSKSTNNVLFTRGWSLQEIALSSRVLWMKTKEIHWTCTSHSACECDPKLKKDDSRRRSSEDWALLWCRLVREYTCRRLTHITDRLPAIAGLAARFQVHLDVPYLYGLWYNSGLLEQLLWFCSHPMQLTSANQLNAAYAPSWSWAGCQGRIKL
ncbi:HET-domain-containing protein, partial [Periconia macrospinosa]